MRTNSSYRLIRRVRGRWEPIKIHGDYNHLVQLRAELVARDVERGQRVLQITDKCITLTGCAYIITEVDN